MDTALLEPGYSRTGSGRIQLIFGDFSQNVAHILLDDNSLVHLHGHPGVDQVIDTFGSLQNARGHRIQFTADALGVLLEMRAA